MDLRRSFDRGRTHLYQSHFTPAIKWVLITVIIAVVIARLFHGVRGRRRRRLLAQLWGCGPVRSPDRNDPFGWKAFTTLRKARAEQRMPTQLGRSMDEIGRNPHTVQRRILWNQSLITRDADNIKCILSDRVSHWEFGVIRGKILGLFTGPSLFTKEGREWKDTRSWVRPQFSHDLIQNLDVFGSHVQELCSRLQPDSHGWTSTTDLQPMFFNMTLDVISEFLYGQSVHSQNPEKQAILKGARGSGVPDTQTFAANLDEASDWLAIAPALGRWYWLLPSKDFKRQRGVVRALVDWYIHRTIDKKNGEKKNHDEKVKGLEPARFVLLEELVKLTSDPTWLRNETLSLLTAGRSTTAALLSWLFYYLARHPAVFHRLRSTILDDFGVEAGEAPISFGRLRANRYLQNCINEAMRLGSPAHSSSRQARIDTTLPRGGGPEGEDPIFVPKAYITARTSGERTWKISGQSAGITGSVLGTTFHLARAQEPA
ncbi:MAG: hypothetical protein Q9222_001848 [Ikaeria aurantiellina]